jgi:hypothetical protein
VRAIGPRSSRRDPTRKPRRLRPANEAADAASTAQMATERQQRMVQQTMRK